ncbi:MAG: DUF2892 domain-containing protein [Elusimicrobiota bacterium]|jgi:hypothetical protein
MKKECLIRAFAGMMILGSLALAQVYGRGWLLLTAFVGLNLLQSAFTRWCLLEDILGRLGFEGHCSDRG